jgi:hypothetical protein
VKLLAFRVLACGFILGLAFGEIRRGDYAGAVFQVFIVAMIAPQAIIEIWGPKQ